MKKTFTIRGETAEITVSYEPYPRTLYWGEPKRIIQVIKSKNTEV